MCTCRKLLCQADVFMGKLRLRIPPAGRGQVRCWGGSKSQPSCEQVCVLGRAVCGFGVYPVCLSAVIHKSSGLCTVHV